MVVNKLRAVWRWTWRSALVLLAILVAFILEENLRGRIMLARYKAELRAKGEKLTLEELNLPLLQGESNDVATLVAVKAELIKLGSRSSIYFVTRLRWVKPGLVTWRGGTNDPGGVIQVPDQNDKAPTKSYRGRDGKEYFSRRATWEDVTPLLASAAPMLSRVKPIAGTDKPLGDINYRTIPGDSSDHSTLDTIAAWFAVTALDEMRHDRRGDAIEHVAMIFSLGKRLGYEKLIASQYRRVGLTEQALDVTWHLLQSDGWTEDELSRLQREWSDPISLDDMLIAIEVERARQVRLFTKLRSSWGEWSRSLRDSLMWHEIQGEGYDFEMFLSDTKDAALQVLWRFAWMDFDEQHLLERWQVTMEGARHAVSHEALCEVLQMPPPFPNARNAYNRARFLCSENWDQSLVLTLGKGMQTETRRQMTIAVIALKRYQLCNGGLPATLDTLVPEFLSVAPLDLMDGKPLRYRTNPESKFLLYSVGIDCKDDGGDPRPLEGDRTFTMWQGRDAVWPQAASER